MKKIIYILIVSLLTVGFAFAGMNDRFSDVQLTDSNGDKIDLPTVSSSQPAGEPRDGRGWVYLKDNSGRYRLVFENQDGNIYVLGNSSIDLPLSEWTRYWTGTEVIHNNSIFWENEKPDLYPYYTSRHMSKAIVFPSLHPLDVDKYGGPQQDKYLNYDKDNLISPMMTTFRVPYNFMVDETLSVELLVHQDPGARGQTTTQAIEIKYDYTIHRLTKPGHWDEAVFKYAPVRVGTVGYQLSPVEVSLPFSTTGAAASVASKTPKSPLDYRLTNPEAGVSESDIRPGDYITVRIARVREPSIVDDLRILKARVQFASDN